MKIKEGFVLREVAGEHVVLPSGSELNLNMMVTLNETGKFLWERLAQGIDIKELVTALTAEYDVSEQDAQKHVAAFVAKLNENGFIE